MAYVGNLTLETIAAPTNSATVTVAGAVSGFRTIKSQTTTGETIGYVIRNDTQEEVGEGVITHGTPDTFTRTTVLSNSLGTTARVNFTGPAQIYMTVPAERAVYRTPTNGITIAGTMNAASLVSVTATISGLLTAQNARISYGNGGLSGAFSATTAPLYVHGTLPPTTPVPTGRRNVNRMLALDDRTRPVPSANQTGSVTFLDVLHQLGVEGGAVADSWDGSRNVFRVTLDERNSPASSLSPTLGSVLPATNATWASARLTATYGGTAAETGYSVGSHLLNYGIISQTGTSTNLTNIRHTEYGLLLGETSSVRVAYGMALNIIGVGGAIPTEQFVALRGQRKGRASPGWRKFIGLGGQGYAGVDPISGGFLSFEGSRSDPTPEAKTGLDIQDVKFGDAAVKFPHGEISGGAFNSVDTGALRIGTGYFRRSSTGATIEARGWRGRPAGYVFEYGTDLVAANPKVTAITNMLGDDDYGGTYRFYSVDVANNRFQRAEVINPPVAYGSAPGAPIEVKLRHASTGNAEFVQERSATTTSHPTPLTATTTDHYVGRYLAYYTGAAAGERKLITAWNASTKTLTTDAFSTSPTASVNVVSNDKFLSPLPTAEDTITNSWQYTKNGGTGTLVRETSPNYAVLTGDGTNALSLDQAVTLPATTDCRIYIAASGGYRIKIGTTRGASDLLDVQVITEPPDEDGDYDIVAVDYGFFTAGTTAHIRIENVDIVPAKIRSVRCADAVAGLSILLGVRAGVEAAPLTLDHTWTALDKLSIQPAGGATEIGGAANVIGDLSLATNKFTVAASSGNVAAAGTLNVTGASTLAALGVTSFTASSTAGVTGNFSVNTNKFTVAAASGNVAAAGTMDVAGNFSVATSKATIDATTGAAVLIGSVTAASFIPSSSTPPTNGMYYPAASTVAWATASTHAMRLDSSQNLVIGHTAASARLHAKRDSTATSGTTRVIYAEGSQSVGNSGIYSGAEISHNWTGSSPDVLANFWGAFINPTSSGSGDVTTFNGIRNIPTHSGSGTVTTFIGERSFPTNSGAGNVTNMYAAEFVPTNSGTGTITTAYGLRIRIDNTNAAGTITNAYGLYIQTPSNSGTITNRWGIYQQDPLSQNVFLGTMTAASFTPSSTTAPSNGMFLPAANTLGWSVNTAEEVRLTATAFSPAANDGNALGTAALSWADLFLASGGVINFANSDLTVTHSTGLLTIAGAVTTTGTITSPTAILGGGTVTPPTIAGGSLYIRSADASAAGPVIDAKGATPQIVLRRANNTAASPTTIASADVIGDLQMRGYDGTVYTAAHAAIQGVAAETWSGAARGTHIDFNTTKIGSINTASSRMRLHADGNLLVGSTTDDGVNRLQVTGAIISTTNVIANGYHIRSVGESLTATGTTRADALQLAAEFNQLGTVASGTGVKLPTGVVGMDIEVWNDGANTCKVYALASETIDGTAGSTGVSLAAAGRKRYIFTAANTWRSV